MKKAISACLLIAMTFALPAWADKAILAPVPPTQIAAPVETSPIAQSAVPVTAGPPAAPIDPTHRSCTSDADCQLVQIRCNSCCPPPADFDAVNKQYAAEDGKDGACTDEHIRSCGVPECGLFTPEPYPVATCQSGKCAMVPHAPEPRTPPQ